MDTAPDNLDINQQSLGRFFKVFSGSEFLSFLSKNRLKSISNFFHRVGLTPDELITLWDSVIIQNNQNIPSDNKSYYAQYHFTSPRTLERGGVPVLLKFLDYFSSDYERVDSWEILPNHLYLKIYPNDNK